MYCICCKKNNVTPSNLNELPEEDILWKKSLRVNKIGGIDKELTINNEMVDDGIIHIIDAGFGSKNDGSRFILSICDDCIEENLLDGTLLYFDNYMSKNSSIELIERSKKIYRRRKNIDDIV